MEREVGGGIGMGKTCKLKAVSFQKKKKTLSSELIFVCACMLSCFGRVRLFVTPWTVVCQAPLFM